MTRTKKILLLALSVFIILLGFGIYKVIQVNNYLTQMGPCGLNIGPCKGRQISMNTDTITVDKYFDIPNGRLSFTRANDSLSPILFKTDKSNKLIWAVELLTGEKDCNIPLCKIDFIKLSTDNSENKITFHNACFGEPGTIYLTKDFDFERMCLCSM